MSNRKLRGHASRAAVSLFVSAAFLVFLGASCAQLPQQATTPTPISMRESITLTTSDHVRIAGDWYPVAEPRGWAILLHMMPATKESYTALATKLQERGIASLAIDFRGHGASEGGPDGHEQFTVAQQQAKIQDVHAAYVWLGDHVQSSGNPFDTLNPKLVIVGASIGANLALEFLRDISTIAGAVLLSPGLNYHGINAGAIVWDISGQVAKGIGVNRRVLLAAGGANDEYATRSVCHIAAQFGLQAIVQVFGKAGHGTAMFDGSPGFVDDVANWIEQSIAK